MVTGEPDEWTDDDHGAHARDGSGGRGERSVSGSDGLDASCIGGAPHPLSAVEQKNKNAISAGH